ncbi:glycogenin-2 [Bombina bombina]|uniref:glycogenin-2 n=1 Tax=Bombina bombina TaxID=8345 RepID=UPI00235AF3C6|nr:glycogenin-2 [Bombina bombina]XP_053562414.1 glycogenin-2 [Bombina bombina]XP_053562415.1 glycogenin-2 [Bombina bombina]
MPVTDQAFVTLCTNDIYCQGALVLGKSLRNHGTSRKLVVMITSQVTTRMRGILNSVFDETIEVDTLDSADSVHLSLLKRPELGITFTKLQCWTLTQYTKCVFMDADTIVLCNIDELFDREEFSAAPDSGWPDCFNSGVFVFRPSIETFGRLLQFAENNGSFDGGDQGLLNSFFSNWSTADISKHLPFIYNLSISNIYTYAPAFKQFGSEAKVIHFIGTPKPWNCKYNPQTQWIVDNESLSGHHNLSFLVLWWQIFISDILPLLAQQEELDKENSQQHQIGRIEIILKNEIPSSVYPEETPSENTDSIPPDNVWEQQTLDDSVPAQEIQLPPQPLTQDIIYMGELAHSVSELSIQETEEQPRTEDERQMWEQGHIDYMGKDSFENIQRKLDRFLH